MSDLKLHRLIPVGDIAAEVAANWVQAQAIPADAQASDPGGLFDRTSAGSRGFVTTCFWEDADRVVVYDAANVGLRPAVKRTVVGSSLVRVSWGDAASTGAPGTDFEYAMERPAPLWLKVTAATPPVGAAFLAIYTAEVP